MEECEEKPESKRAITLSLAVNLPASCLFSIHSGPFPPLIAPHLFFAITSLLNWEREKKFGLSSRLKSVVDEEGGTLASSMASLLNDLIWRRGVEKVFVLIWEGREDAPHSLDRAMRYIGL